MNNTHIDRRTMLKGLGGITVGLPLLEEMLVTNAWGAPKAEVPTRAFNVFFGLGIPAPLQEEGFEGVDRLFVETGLERGVSSEGHDFLAQAGFVPLGFV